MKDTRSSALESPAVHCATVKIEPFPGFEIFERIIGTHLSSRGKTCYETSLLAIDKRVGTTVPGSPLPLNETEQKHQEGNMPDIVNNVLKPPLLDDLPLINLLVGIVSHKQGLSDLLAQGC